MASGFKHFSHKHNLIMHEMPEGAEVSCSGCNSSATKMIYICWQCSFYLHGQCFQATRSRRHPSHPQHPLTLVPYPTYPSNSFYCNSCKVIGTGFSYSCSDCDFDLHVQCAYSISSATNFHQPHPVNSSHPHYTSYPNQEMFPIPNAPSISIPTPIPVPNLIPIPDQYPINVNQDSYMAPNQIPMPTQIAIPNPIPVPVLTQYPINVTKDSYIAPNPIPTSIPIPTAQYPVNQDSYTAQNATTFVPTSVQNPVTNAQNAYISQSFTSIPTSAHNSSIPQHLHTPLASAPTSVPNSQTSSQNKTKTPGIKHFSHPHGLVLVNIKHGKKKITCSGCQETLVGKGYACVEQNCGFQLDESCFNLKIEIQHKSHPPHPLTLLSSSPYKNQNGKFTCNACFKDGTGFNYHCSICEHDLHVKCANLSETVKRDDHEHVLKLYCECPLMGEEYTFFCDVCNQVVHRDHWTYYCKECDFGTHLDCVDRQVCDETNPDHVDDTTTDQQRLEEAIENARISAIARKNMLDSI